MSAPKAFAKSLKRGRACFDLEKCHKHRIVPDCEAREGQPLKSKVCEAREEQPLNSQVADDQVEEQSREESDDHESNAHELPLEEADEEEAEAQADDSDESATLERGQPRQCYFCDMREYTGDPVQPDKVMTFGDFDPAVCRFCLAVWARYYCGISANSMINYLNVSEGVRLNFFAAREFYIFTETNAPD